MTRLLTFIPPIISAVLCFVIGFGSIPPVWPVAIVLKFLAALLLVCGARIISICLAVTGSSLIIVWGCMNGNLISAAIGVFFLILYLALGSFTRS